MRIKSALVLLLAISLVSMSGCQNKTPAADAPSSGSSSGTAEVPSDAATANMPDQRFVSTGDLEKDATHVAQLVEQLRTSLAEDLARLQTKVKATDSAAEKQKIYLAENPVPQFINDSLQTIETFPKAPATLKIASSVLAHVSADQKNTVMMYMLEHCCDRLDQQALLEQLSGEVPSADIERWLFALAKHTPEGQKQADMLLGVKLFFDRLPFFRIGLKHNPQIVQRLPESQVNFINQAVSQEREDQVAACLQTIIDKYGELEYFNSGMQRGDTYGEVATNHLYELRNLSIGKVAPNIVGEDLDGIAFELEDYRGKVVMLDFWGHWCPPCRRMYPHEQVIVRQLAGLPFALVGVNSDRNLKTVKDVVEDDKLPWRNFWNGPQGTDGPIASKWNVQDWPTIYLIDGDGVIRYKGVQGIDLDRGIEDLMGEIGHPVDLVSATKTGEPTP